MFDFNSLVRSESAEIRGSTYKFYEIGAADWLNYCQADDEKLDDMPLKELVKRNNAYSARVAACALKPGTEQTVEELAQEIEALPASLLTDFYDAAARANGLPTVSELTSKEDSAKKTSPASDSPESSPES